MSLSRRRFLRAATAASMSGLVSGALPTLFARMAGADDTPWDHRAPWRAEGYGPLVADPAGLLDLPAGFQYRAFSTARVNSLDDRRFSQKLTNGDPVPCSHDGMGAFAGPNDLTVLVRNHEVNLNTTPIVDPRRERPYDPMGVGGTTTLWVDADRKLVRSFASLSGTVRNCAGGITPWGSWLTCEECTYMPGQPDRVEFDRTPLVTKRHGYVFEVDSRAEGLVDPVPIVPMGRFYHEACAVDPATGFVYLSEDRPDGVLYRYRPDVVTSGKKTAAGLVPGDLAKGGVLEAMSIGGMHQARTQNWDDPTRFRPGRRWTVGWVPVPNIDPDVDQIRDPRDENPDPLKRSAKTAPTSTRAQAWDHGAAQFARVEGVAYGHGALYWCCTNGGPAGVGQVWKLDLARGELSLVVEPDDTRKLDGPDNLVVAPNGDLVICEDGTDDDYVVGVTPNGKLYHLARNATGDVELAGACFSPDGQTLFFNVQDPGITFAVWGPWEQRRA